MHYLITGGAGFIGSHLTERLIRGGHKVTIIDDFNTYYDPAIKRQNIARVLDQIELIEGDIRDAILVERTFAKGEFDQVIHIAARAGVRPSIQDPKLYFTTNIDGIMAAANYDKNSFEIFNLGGSATTTLSELIKMIETATGKKAQIEYLPDQPGDVPRTYADHSKARKLLGYEPQTPIADGIKKYVQWFREQHA